MPSRKVGRRDLLQASRGGRGVERPPGHVRCPAQVDEVQVGVHGGKSKSRSCQGNLPDDPDLGCWAIRITSDAGQRWAHRYTWSPQVDRGAGPVPAADYYGKLDTEPVHQGEQAIQLRDGLRGVGE